VNSERRMVWLTHVCQVAWRFITAPKDWQIDHPHTQKGRQSECTNCRASLCLVSQEECMSRCQGN